RDELLAEADAADAAVARGDSLGPLHGLPHAIKDLALTKGLRTTYGSPLFADFIPTVDTVSVERIRRAGVVLIGKTNTPEMGLGSHTYNPVFGITRNAYDPAKSAGGSSGGAAAALALRLLPVADGSDMGGSLRNPAAFNNVFGLRPSQGRVPYAPVADGYFSQLSTDGPMARSIADLALLLSVQAGYDARAPLSLDGEGAALVQGLEADPRGRRLAWLGDLGGHLPFEPGILELCKQGLALLGDLGCTVEPAAPDFDWEKLWQAFVAIRQFNVGGRYRALYDDPAKRTRLKPEMQWEIEHGKRLGALEVFAAAEVRTAWYNRALELFRTYDGLLLPTAQVFPFTAETHWPDRINGKAMDSYHRWMEVVVPGTLSGCPVISVPVGFSAAGLPMGMQIIGRPRGERALLQLARAYEQVCPWLSVLPG
ncbi:MAG TPA: amidase, partial [Candidatus Sulfotelmatobacter sp.]|nr:amidase [Candidatus Sulfotelmatobacter sp.]